MSAAGEDDEKKKKEGSSSGDSSSSSSTEQQQQIPQQQKKRPVIGKPIGTPVGQAKPPPSAPPPSQPAAPQPSAPAARPVVGRPTIGTPARPAVGQPPGTTASRPAVARPSIGSAPTTPGRPVVPLKQKQESREEISRRNFLRGLVIIGGLGTLALSTYGALDFMTGTVESSGLSRQQIFDAATGAGNYTTPLSLNPSAAGYVPENSWKTFIYPRTGNVNIDSDTFSQNVLIHLPKGWTAPSNLSFRDPSTGDYYVAFSRVCVHLWCLWSYNPTIQRGACPCHGSQYQPGGIIGSSNPFLALGATEPGIAVAGPASLQVAPNNQLPLITLDVDSSGNFFATGRIGAVGCGQKC